MGGGQSRESAYDKLASHREQLYQRQLQHRQQCEETKRQAAEQLRLGNRTGALNLARQLKTLQAQEKTIAGIVTNLDAQKASMETKQITAETMTVMSQAVRSMGRGVINVETVEDTLEANDDLAADLKEVAEALALPYSATDDEEDLLSGLIDTMDAQNLGSPVGTPAAAAGKTTDETFMDYMRARAANIEFPAVPTHQPGGGTRPEAQPLTVAAAPSLKTKQQQQRGVQNLVM